MVALREPLSLNGMHFMYAILAQGIEVFSPPTTPTRRNFEVSRSEGGPKLWTCPLLGATYWVAGGGRTSPL